MTERPPLYPQLLRLKHVHPNAWQRALLGEGMAAVGVLLALADLASAWSALVLPVAVGGVVKAHDVLTGLLQPAGAPAAVAAPAPVASAPVDLPDAAAEQTAEPAAVRLIPPPEPEPEPEPVRVGSAALWALLAAAQERAADGSLVPFALLAFEDGVVEVRPPVLAAAVLTAEEQAGALRTGLTESASSPQPPHCAVLAADGADGLCLVGYEPGLAGGVLTDGDLQVRRDDLPSVY